MRVDSRGRRAGALPGRRGGDGSGGTGAFAVDGDSMTSYLTVGTLRAFLWRAEKDTFPCLAAVDVSFVRCDIGELRQPYGVQLPPPSSSNA